MTASPADRLATTPAISISPRTATGPEGSAAAMSDSKVFLTPRVLDQDAFNEMAEALRTLIDEAGREKRSLQAAAEEARENRSQMDAASRQLHERLRLGARMLKAFQSQIVRIESAISDLETARNEAAAAQEQLDERARAFDETMQQIVDRCRQQCDETVETALARLDGQITERTVAIEDMQQAIEASEQRATKAAEAGETAERTTIAMAHRCAELSQDVEERLRAAEGVIDRCREAAASLDAHVHQSSDAIDEQDDRARAIAANLKEEIQQADGIREQIRQAIAQLDEARDAINIDVEACEALEDLLERLQPWASIVEAPSGESGLPEPFERMIETTRAALRDELNGIASALRSAAARFEEVPADSHPGDPHAPDRNGQSRGCSTTTTEDDPPAPTVLTPPRASSPRSASAAS